MAKQQNTRVRRARMADVHTLETALITAKALGRETVPYEVLQAIFGGMSAPALWSILKMSMRQAIADKRPILAAMAVGRSGEPGRGFHDCLRQAGINVPNDPAAEKEEWKTQLALVHAMDTEHL